MKKTFKPPKIDRKDLAKQKAVVRGEPQPSTVEENSFHDSAARQEYHRSGWKWRFTMSLLEEIGRECSTQVLVKVMVEVWWTQAQKAKGYWKSTFERGYAAICRWTDGDDNNDEINALMADLMKNAAPGTTDVYSYEEEDGRRSKAYLAMVLLCSNPNRPYENKVKSDENPQTKQELIWEFGRNINHAPAVTNFIRKLMPMPPKDPDQMYCILDNMLVGACTLHSMSERIQCMWDSKWSGHDMSCFKEKKC